MVKIVVSSILLKQLNKVFGQKKALEILDLFETLEENPKKGAEQSEIISTSDFSNLQGKEVGRFRFYFVCDNFKIKFLKVEELKDLIIKFIRMSKKDNQDRVIEEIFENY